LRKLPDNVTMVSRNQGRAPVDQMQQWHIVILEDSSTGQAATGYSEGYQSEEKAYEQALELLGHPKPEEEEGA
jgi:hypothetical protein